MSLKPYPEYKESGVKWLGNVPAGWRIAPIKVISSFNDEVLPELTDPEYKFHYVEISDVSHTHGITFGEPITFADAASRARRVVREGDVLVSTVRTYLRAIAGARSIPSNTIASTGFAVLRPKNCDAQFLAYALLGEHSIGEIIARSVGVSYPAINATDLVKVKLPVPGQDEQHAIAEYLDRETDEIDAFIADQEELITLLAERRTATITQAVTKGLDPDAPVKDSGNQWIAALPAHWAVTAMKHLTELQTGVTLGKTYSEDAEEYPYLRVANVQVGYVDLSTLKTVQVTKEVANRSMLRPGDVLMTEGGDRDKLGRGCIWDAQVQPCLHQNHVFAVRCSEQLSNAFLVYVLDSQVARNYFNVTAKQTTNLAATNSTLVKNFRFGLPPLTEQHDILAYLDRETAEIDAAIADAREAIALSKERRAAVISAAVTGKIDVRGLVAPATNNVEAESVGIA